MNFTNALGRAALNLESHYVISGEFTLPEIRISFSDPRKKELCLPCALNSNQEAIGSIYNHASTSGFGHKGETIIDESIRRAKEIRPGEIKFQDGLNLLHHKNCDDILEQVRQALVPDCDKVTAELDKMNIYTEGCHFKSHYDTPRGDGFFGTLVLVLPSLHVGGEIKIEKPGSSNQSFTTDFSELLIPQRFWSEEKKAHQVLNKSKQRTSWSNMDPTPAQAQEKLKSVMPRGIIQWVAFFGDCKHQVQSVHFGTRFSLSYLLRRVDNSVSVPAPLLSKDENILLQRAKNFQKILISALKEEDFCFRGAELGFACIHLYEDRELPNVDEQLKPDTSAQTLNLKGADALVCIAAAQLGLKVTVIRLVTEYCAGERWSVRKIPDVALIKKFGRMGYWQDARCRARLIDAEDVEKDLGGAGHPIDNVEWCVRLPGLKSFCAPPPQDPAVQPLMARYVNDIVYSATGYYGNEASRTDFYTHAAILIDIPSWDDRLSMKICSTTDDCNSPKEIISQEHLKGLKTATESQDDEVLSFQCKLSRKQDVAPISAPVGDFHSSDNDDVEDEDSEVYCSGHLVYDDDDDEMEEDDECDDGSLLLRNYNAWFFGYNDYDSDTYFDEDDDELLTVDYHSMTVAQLKSECRSAGLKVGGRKAELILRLQENNQRCS